MPLFAVEYTYTENSTEVRDEYRPRHRAWLRHLHDAGTLLLSGPFTDNAGALLIFAAADEASLAELLTADPFHEAEVVANARITGWTPVIGPITAE